MRKTVSLRVPFFPQPKGVGWCVPACLQMVMAYHGDKVPLQEIVDDIGVTRHGGLDEMHAAIYLLRRGYGVRLLGWHQGYPASFSKVRGELPAGTFVDWAFRDVKHPSMYRVACRSYCMEFLDRGGILEPRPASVDDLYGALGRREPPIVIVSVTTLWHTDSTGTHAIVCTGMSEWTASFLDPSLSGGKSSYRHDVFLHAFYRVEGSALLISPPKRR